MAYTAITAVANAVTGTGKPAGPPHWQVELFDCMGDTNVCIQTWCCIFCTESNLIMMRERGVPQLDPYTCVAACCLDVITRGFFASSLALGLRRELVQRYGIQDEDYCVSVLHNVCVPCNLCMIQREMAMRNEHPGGLLAQPPASASSAMGKVTGAIGGAATALGIRPWGSTLFQCSGAEECLDSCCLGCCTLAHMANRVDAGRVQTIPAGSPNKMEPKTCVGAWCCLPQFNFAMRRELIDKYQITEPHIVSFVLVAFCSPCALAQARREMGYRNEWPGGILVKEAPARPMA